MILGITGGTGSGKTTLLQAIRQQGGEVLDCDAIYHTLLSRDGALLAAVEARFPGTVTAGQLDRKALGAIVFSDADALQDLNAITHTAVKAYVLQILAQRPADALTAIDAIGLFESGLAEHCPVTVAVTAPEEDRVRRLMLRDGISEDYARSRIRAQHGDAWYRDRCTFCLENSGSWQEFQGKCLAFLDRLRIMEESNKKERSL